MSTVGPAAESAVDQVDAGTGPCCPDEDRGWQPCGPDCDTYDTDPA